MRSSKPFEILINVELSSVPDHKFYNAALECNGVPIIAKSHFNPGTLADGIFVSAAYCEHVVGCIIEAESIGYPFITVHGYLWDDDLVGMKLVGHPQFTQDDSGLRVNAIYVSEKEN